MADGLRIVEPEHVLDDHLVAQADAEGEAAVRGDRRGERLLGEGRGVARIGRDDERAQLDALGDLAGEGEEHDGVEAEDVRDPGGGEALLLGALELLEEGAEAVARADAVADTNSDAHSSLLAPESRALPGGMRGDGPGYAWRWRTTTGMRRVVFCW